MFLLLAGCSLALSGCCSARHAARWEYKTIVLPNDAVPLDQPSKGWTSEDAVLNAMLQEGWRVAGYSVDHVNSQWFLLKRHKKSSHTSKTHE